MMLHVSYQHRNVRLDACWKIQNYFQSVSWLRVPLLFSFIWDKSLFTAVGATKHAGVKKCIVFQIDKCVRQSFVEVKQTAISVRFLQFNKFQLVSCRQVIHRHQTDQWKVSSIICIGRSLKTVSWRTEAKHLAFQYKTFCQCPDSSVAMTGQCESAWSFLTLFAARTTATLPWMLLHDLLGDKQVSFCLATSNSDHSNVVSHRTRRSNQTAMLEFSVKQLLILFLLLRNSMTSSINSQNLLSIFLWLSQRTSQ